ncbi:MAG: methyl-accepting chemotaxis protein [Xanthomonadales bacterium]|nr:methyl-accepting chemotaxis protein [Xanthomonadales bacterium]
MNATTDKKSLNLRSWLIMLVTGLLLVLIAFVAVTFFEQARTARHEQEWVSLAMRMQVSSQQLAKSAGEAAAGNLEAFGELRSTHQRMQQAMLGLTTGQGNAGAPAVPSAVIPELSRLNSTWRRVSDNATAIIEREALVLELAEASAAFKALVPDMQEAADSAVRRLTESGAPGAQVFGASRALVLVDRMLRRVTEILQGGSNAVNASRNLENEMNLLNQVLNALLRGNASLGITQVRNPQALNSLGEARRLFAEARPRLQAILDSSTDLFEVRGAADEIVLDSTQAYQQAGALAEAIAGLPESRAWPSLRSGVIGLVVMLAMAVILVGFVIAAERHRATEATSRNRRNQRAILKLLDELGSLADGDLTVHASVDNEMTGAIADAVNYAVERLRELVMAINDTAESVANSAQDTRTSASRLAEAAGHQAEQIDEAAESIKEMAQSFDVMAERSVESRGTAQKSVDMAHQGAEKVRESISGMDMIRDQIQKTSKRIKRLGESSQEIGDIIGLINGIAEQTNVLALNAAIQAASAGESGKGFAVVADEVQQLAESASQATRRIESLVQTIQADTAEAIASMENTTSEVVDGTRLAEDAGSALEQIEKVSTELSGLIQGIAEEAQEHSLEATRLSGHIHEIREVSVSTSSGSKRTAEAVENLAELVLELREKVADFKLPREDA